MDEMAKISQLSIGQQQSIEKSDNILFINYLENFSKKKVEK